MKMKRITAAFAALLAALAMPLCAFAEPEPEQPPEEVPAAETSLTEEEPVTGTETSPTETSPTETTPAETTTTETTTVTTTTVTERTVTATVTTAAAQTSETASSAAAYTPASAEPSKVALEVGAITDGKFDVNVTISPETKITTARLTIEFDNSVLTFTGSEINDYGIGGMPVDSVGDSIYTFSYINTAGTDYSGVYTTLHFTVKDDSVSSSVIYVTVETLEDMNLQEVPNIVQNGIVKLREDDADFSAAPNDSTPQEDALTMLHIYDNALPTTLGELGIPDETNIKTVKLLDETVARYEQGALIPVSAGETELIVKYITGKELRFRLVVQKAPVLPGTPSAAEPEDKPDTSMRNLAIAAAVLFALAAVALEYIFIMKPFDRKPASKEQEEADEFVAYDDDDAPEIVQDPEEMFARRRRRSDAPGKNKQK